MFYKSKECIETIFWTSCLSSSSLNVSGSLDFISSWFNTVLKLIPKTCKLSS